MADGRGQPDNEELTFRFRLVTQDGQDLGASEFGSEVWEAGDLLPITAERYLRIVAVDYNPEGAELSGTLTVEHVA